MLTAGEISRGQIVTVYSWFQTHQEVHVCLLLQRLKRDGSNRGR